MATIVSKFLNQCALKVSVNTVSALARVVIDLGYGAFLDEISEMHSTEVNPNALSVSHSTLEDMRLSCALAQYKTTYDYKVFVFQ